MSQAWKHEPKVSCASRLSTNSKGGVIVKQFRGGVRRAHCARCARCECLEGTWRRKEIHVGWREGSRLAANHFGTGQIEAAGGVAGVDHQLGVAVIGMGSGSEASVWVQPSVRQLTKWRCGLGLVLCSV